MFTMLITMHSYARASERLRNISTTLDKLYDYVNGPGSKNIKDLDLELLNEIKNISNKPDLYKIEKINTFFNEHIRYTTDIDAWGISDYWATPFETLEKGMGDCEDYSIGKYFALVKSGIPLSKLRLVYVYMHSQDKQVAHMVVVFEKNEKEQYVLDNLINTIKKVEDRPDLIPVFSFGLNGTYGGLKQTSANLSRTSVSKWDSVVNRSRMDGWF